GALIVPSACDAVKSDASSAATIECRQSLRGCSEERELHACGRGVGCHTSSRQPTGQNVGGETRTETLRSRAPTPPHHRSWPRISCRGARCAGSTCRRHRPPRSAPILWGSDGQHLT